MVRPVLCALLLLVFSMCKSQEAATSAPKPPEQYASSVESEIPVLSTLTIPVSISLTELMQGLNTRLSSAALYEDFSFDDNGGDNLMMNAWKSRDFTATISGNTIKYRLPLKLWMKYRLPLGGAAEGDGELALGFRTNFTLNADWSLNTQTVVEYHEWLTKPRLKTGLGDVNIESLSNIVLNRSKNNLAASIDRAVSQQMSLRPHVETVWKAIQEPTMLSEEYKMWVKTIPRNIGITPLRTANDVIRAKIAVECENDVTFGEKPSFRENSTLPNLRLLQDAPDDFQMHFATDVPYTEAERLAKNAMIGYTFEAGKKKVRVEDINLWGNNDRLVVNTRLSGAFNGNIYFLALPVFNAEKNQIEVSDLDYHMETRNFLLKSAGWLFQGPIKKKLKESMTFPLHENLTSLKPSVQSSLTHYEIQPGVVLTGTVDSVSVEQIRLLPKGIRVDLYSKGKVNVDVKGL